MEDKLQFVPDLDDKLKLIGHSKRRRHCALPAHSKSKNKPRLQLKHPRWVDVCERRDCVCGRAHAAHKLAECGCRCRGIAVGCDCAAKKISVIEDVEAFHPEQDCGPF